MRILFAKSRHLVCTTVLLLGSLVRAGEPAPADPASPLADPKPASDRSETDKKALAPLQAFVGAWKGAGTLKGGAASEGWSEEAEWRWEFKDGRAALVFSSPHGKYFASGKLEPGEKPGTYLFTGQQPGGKNPERYTGGLMKGGDLELTAEAAGEAQPVRLTLGTVAKGKRLLVLYERLGAGANTFSPLAEVGLTRQGSGFGKEQSGKECILTGGAGTISVTYKGQSYYFCCSGCKATFLENPEKELATYRKRKEEERAQQKAPPEK